MAPQPRDHDRYDILGEHGRGGLGRVSRAHDRELGRDIAIKELISRGHLGEVRFLREALITARLEHPGIVPVYEAGRWADGTPFYAMKLVSGRPLRTLIAERKTVDERIGLLHHVIAVADAIAYAHGRNIIHRDLKPANVIVGEFGETVVIDWGLAKDLSDAEDVVITGGPFRDYRDDGLTSAGTVLGTPAYMAPEQARGEPVDQRADVYAIGAMLWELCSLHKLPPGLPGQRRRALRRSGIDPDLITIIEKAVDPEPARRYPDAGALAADLKAFKAGARIAARRYSLWALLAHWTRRHRTAAIASVAALGLAIAGAVLYLHAVTTERDRADATLVVAQRELERAQLAEASLLLEKDPTSAGRLLRSLDRRSPQHALLLSRASQTAAIRVIDLPARGHKLLRNPVTSAIAVRTVEGGFEAIDVEAGRHRALDDHLLGAVTSHQGGWLYARRPFAAPSVTLVDTAGDAGPTDVGVRLSDINDTLLISGAHVYALDKHDLYTLDEPAPVLVKSDIRNIAGNADLLLVCTMERELQEIRDGTVQRRARCTDSGNPSSLATSTAGYAAALDADHLLLVRSGQPVELAMPVPGSYSLALSDTGLLALADLSDRTWFVRPGTRQLESGPSHASLPTEVAAAGQFAAWGYADGVIVVLDTETQETWEFRGHDTFVLSLLIDPDHARLLSMAGPQLRVWSLARPALHEIAPVPCAIYTVTPSPDGTQAAFDCHDGTLRVWSPGTDQVEDVHHHMKIAFGTAWWRGQPCSAGFDGRVLCTAPGEATREIFASTDRIRWLTASPDHTTLAIATPDGKLWSFDGSVRLLYAHDAPAYRMAFSPDGQFLASGADDGSVILYDLAQQRVVARPHMHTGRVMSIAWQGHELWTSGADGVMQRWQYQDAALTLIETAREPGALRFLHPFRAGWIGNSDNKMLVIAPGSPAQTLRLDLGRHVQHVELSPDQRYVAATVAGEVIVVDLQKDAVASFPIVSEGIGYVGFVTSRLLVVSMANAFYSIAPDQLSYSPFHH